MDKEDIVLIIIGLILAATYPYSMPFACMFAAYCLCSYKPKKD